MSDEEDNGAPALSREEEEEMKKQRAAEELKEYQEMRREEKEKEQEEIQKLRERRERRKTEREEEDRRLAELRNVEEQRRRAEEEERGRKKREEEQRRRDDRERKKREVEEKTTKSIKPNFVITKKHGGTDSEEIEPEHKEENVAKSKEQIEAERRAILEQRIEPLKIEGFDMDQLKEKAKELYDLIYRLESEKYDLEHTFQQQAYEMTDLAERARQMNKGGKGSKANVQAEPDPLASKISGIPPKICMYSQYERVKDRRTFTERKTMYKGPLYGEEYIRIIPTSKVIQTEMGFVADGDYEPPAPKGAPVAAPTAVPADAGKSNSVTENVPQEDKTAEEDADNEITLELDEE